eukprot:682956_1
MVLKMWLKIVGLKMAESQSYNKYNTEYLISADGGHASDSNGTLCCNVKEVYWIGECDQFENIYPDSSCNEHGIRVYEWNPPLWRQIAKGFVTCSFVCILSAIWYFYWTQRVTTEYTLGRS